MWNACQSGWWKSSRIGRSDIFGKRNGVPRSSAVEVANTGVDGMRDLLRALRRIPKELEQEVKDASREIAERAVADIRRSANTRAERKAAQSVRARAGRDPRIAAGGGARTVGGPMFFGTEFGGGRRPTTQQFRPWSGTQGYWLYPTVRTYGRQWAEHWLDAIDDVLKKEWRNR